MVKPRAQLHNLSVCEHGGKPGTAKTSAVIDFSTNLNPYGPPGFLSEAINEAIHGLNRYPDNECRELKAKISSKFGCREEEVQVGAGVSELIPLVAHAFAKKRVLMLKHTYGEYELAARVTGAKVKQIEMPGLRIQPELIVAEMQPEDVVFVCNPNNPTGQYLGKEEQAQLIEAAERLDALLVIDEAYVEFVPDAYPLHSCVSSSRNLLILRSITKSFAIPGVRIGYAIGSEAIIQAMQKIKTPWSVSVFAEKIGTAVISAAGDAFLKETTAKIETGKQQIEAEFAVQSDANFYILDVCDASKMKAALLEHGLVVRDCTSFGLPTHVRFSVRSEAENNLLINTLLELISTRNR